MNLQFLIIDPQNDFANPNGSLFVPDADKDSEKLQQMIKRHLHQINQIHVTLDTHHLLDIAHPLFWINSKNQHPAPFTCITLENVENHKWQTTDPSFQKRATAYVKALKNNGRYDLIIWPPHCLIGSLGNNIVAPILDIVLSWEQNQFSMANYVIKGLNIWTEHYSAIEADVPDLNDPSTQLNLNLIEKLASADIIAISGQALSHCVANTVRDIANHIGNENIHKMVLIEDTTSSVPSFEHLGQEFLTEMKARGMQTAKSLEYLV
jgi:nicotinamidase-related amidase